MDYFMASKILFSNYKMLFLFMTCLDILINSLDLHFSQLMIYSYRIPKLYFKIHYGHTTVFSNLSSGLPFYLQNSDGEECNCRIFSSGNAHVWKRQLKKLQSAIWEEPLFIIAFALKFIFLFVQNLQFLLFPGCDSK